MNVKMLKILLILLLIILMQGCSSKEPRVETKYVDRVNTQIVETKCEVPVVKCHIDTNSTATQKLYGVGSCFDDLVKANGVFR